MSNGTQSQMVGSEKEPPPPYVATRNPSPRRFRIPPGEPNLWKSRNGSRPGQPGRPPIEFDPRTNRSLVRLFVKSPEPLEPITKAFGPNRLCLRNQLGKLTGAGPGSDMRLGDIRSRNRNGESGLLKRFGRRTPQNFQAHCKECGHSLIALGGKESTAQDTGLGTEYPTHDGAEGLVVWAVKESDADQPPWQARQHIFFPFSEYPDIEALDWNENLDIVDSSQAQDELGVVSESDAVLDQLAYSGASMAHNSSRPEPPLDTNIEAHKGPSEHGHEAFGSKNYRQERIPSMINAAVEFFGGKGGPAYHYMRCCSVWKPTIASRVWSTSSQCNIYTEESEYRLYYANPLPTGRVSVSAGPSRTASQPPPTRAFNRRASEPSVIECILKAHTDGVTDEDIEKNIAQKLSIKDESTRKDLVNIPDDRGVTALHLSVAYGLWKTCGLLMRHGADVKARTLKGTCISHFAKPAERLAGRLTGEKENDLYFRIMHCREHVRNGDIPPVPNRDPNWKPKKRRGSVLFAGPSNHGQRHLRKKPAPATPSTSCESTLTSQASPIVSETLSRRVLDEPLFTRGLTVSPASTAHGDLSISGVQDFAKSRDSMRQRVLRHNLHHPLQPSFPNHAYTSDEISSFDAGTTLDFGQVYALQHACTLQSDSAAAHHGIIGGHGASPGDDPLASHALQTRTDLANPPIPMTETIAFEAVPELPPGSYYREEQVLGTDSSQSAAWQRYAPVDSLQERQVSSQPDMNITGGIQPSLVTLAGNENFDSTSTPHLPEVFRYFRCQHGHPRTWMVSYCPERCPPERP